MFQTSHRQRHRDKQRQERQSQCREAVRGERHCPRDANSPQADSDGVSLSETLRGREWSCPALPPPPRPAPSPYPAHTPTPTPTPTPAQNHPGPSNSYASQSAPPRLIRNYFPAKNKVSMMPTPAMPHLPHPTLPMPRTLAPAPNISPCPRAHPSHTQYTDLPKRTLNRSFICYISLFCGVFVPDCNFLIPRAHF